MRYFSYFWVFIFVVFAILQFNDPDPYLWIPIYLVAAIISWLASRQIYNKAVIIASMVLYFVGGIYLFPMDIQQWISREEKAKSLAMNMPFIEEARESMGLLICFLVMTVYLFAASNVKKRSKSRR